MLVYQILLSITALFFGSLTGVLVKRVPENKDFGFSRSACPHCGYQLKWYENIPLISYVILLAQCSNCKEKISSFYPMIEIGFLICSIPFINIAVKRFMALNGFLDQGLIFLDFVFHLVFISLALALGLIDNKYKELPHKLTYTGLLIAILYVSLFGSEYYNSAQSLSEVFDFMPGILLSSLSAIKQFAMVIFSLDLSIYFINLLFFRENALLDKPVALSFGNERLQEKTTLLYLIYSIFVLTLIYFAQQYLLDIFFIVVGLLYLYFEVFAYFRGDGFTPSAPAMTESSEANPEKKTVLGGGDIIMLGFFACLLGFQKTFLVFVSSFYIAFIFLMLKIIKNYFSFQMEMRKELDRSQDKNFDIKSMFRGNIALGLALAISFIAVMMMLAK